ncbi:adenylyl-sulfate kinase [bacterium]|nr:adenylyl-sulfate kinase [bacterium]
MVIWVTGLSGAGKTTLCRALGRLLKPEFPEIVLLDGDGIREVFGNDLSHTEADRTIQIKRVQRFAKMLSDQGLIVLVAVVYSHPDLLRWNREHLHEYFEIYLQSSLDALKQRDSKGLYARAQAGEIRDVVGIDIPWHPPARADLTLRMDELEPPDDLAGRVAMTIPRFARVLPPV